MLSLKAVVVALIALFIRIKIYLSTVGIPKQFSERYLRAKYSKLEGIIGLATTARNAIQLNNAEMPTFQDGD